MIHYTAMADCAAAHATLCNPATEVSAHYLISEQGEVMPLVAEAKRAWHAGAGRWGAVSDINSRSIGIELSNLGVVPFAAAQMDALEALLAGVMARWAIPPERVIAHSDCAPGRKIDPGSRFDWQRLARQGLAVAAKPRQPAPDADFAALLRQIGYTADAPPEALLHAFRLRFHQGAHGPVSAADIARATGLAADYPVDGARDNT